MVLMGPWLVWWEVFAIRETKVDRVKGHNQIFVLIDLLESTHDARLCANFPDEILVADPIVRAHSFFVDDWEMVFVDGRGIVAIISKLAKVDGQYRIYTALRYPARIHVQAFQV